MTLDQFLGIECFSLKRYTRKNILSKVVLSHISSYESTCPNFENESESHSVMSDSLWPHVLYSPWNSPGQSTGVGSLSFLQGIFPTQGSNPGLLHCRRILYQLNNEGSPRILEWVAYPFSRGSPQSKNRTRVSCIAGRFSLWIGKIPWRRGSSTHSNILAWRLPWTV